MAATSYGTNDPLTVKLWSKKLAVEVLKQTWASRFMGMESSNIIQVKDELSKSAGDKITYGLRMQLSGQGVIGDGALVGNEEALTTYSDSIVINQLRNAVRSAGRMSQQRIPFSIRQESLDGLRDWWTDRLDYSFMNQICGNVAQTNLQYTGLQAPIAPDANHYMTVSSAITTDEGLGSTNIFSNIQVIDRAVERAKTLTPAIRPVRVDGKEFYVAFLHPYQVTDLRQNSATGQFLDLNKAIATGGVTNDNPIFDGSLGVYNGVIFHEDYRVSTGCNSTTSAAISTVRRAVMCGGQASMLAFGRDNSAEKFTWVEELFDYENELGVSAGLIFGLKKTVFNSQDFATIVMSSYAVSH